MSAAGVYNDTDMSIVRYMSDFGVTATNIDSGITVIRADQLFDNATKTLRAGFCDLNITANKFYGNPRGFYWPFGEADVVALNLMQNTNQRLALKSWDELPTSLRVIRLSGLHVETFKNVERLENMSTLYVEGHQHGTIITCGLLRLLKCPKLIRINYTPTIERRLRDALWIVESYLTVDGSERDIIACQSELIERGLEEYAKL